MSELLKGVIPIRKKFLQRNYLFALEFSEGFVFGRVIRRRLCQYKPWPLIDADADAIDIPDVTHQAELRFVDPRSPTIDLLYLESTTSTGLPWFYHGAIGIKPQQVNSYLRYPEGKEIPGKFPSVNPIRPAYGDDISPLNGINSPYEQPTDYHELVIVPQIHIASEYYNKDEHRHHQPVMNLDFCLYWVQIFTPVKHRTLISDIAARRYEGARATFFTVGLGDSPEVYGPTLVKDWGTAPLTLDEAMALGGR